MFDKSWLLRKQQPQYSNNPIPENVKFQNDFI